MFCPRCGRPVSDIANFCGGCGLPKAEIEKAYREKAEQMPAPVAAPDNEPVNIEEIKVSSLDGERIFGRASARKVEVGRYSADTPNNPRQD